MMGVLSLKSSGNTPFSLHGDFFSSCVCLFIGRGIVSQSGIIAVLFFSLIIVFFLERS